MSNSALIRTLANRARDIARLLREALEAERTFLLIMSGDSIMCANASKAGATPEEDKRYATIEGLINEIGTEDQRIEKIIGGLVRDINEIEPRLNKLS